jgi:hypothetical protein
MDLIDVIDTRLLDLQSEMSKLQALKELEQKKQAPQVEVPLFKLSEKLQRELDSLNSTLRSKLQMEVVVNQFLGTLQLVQHYSDISYTLAIYSEKEVRAKMNRMLGTTTTTNPIQYWFNHISGLVNALQVLFELTGGRFYEFDLKYDFTNSLLTFNFNQFQVVVTDFSSVSLGRVEVSKEVAGSRAMKFNLGSEGLVLDFSNSVNELITAKITVPCNFYSNSGLITKINEAMEKIESFLHSARIPV